MAKKKGELEGVTECEGATATKAQSFPPPTPAGNVNDSEIMFRWGLP